MRPADLADFAEQFVRQHAERAQCIDRLYARLERVDRAIAAWDEREAQRELPDDVRPLVPEAREPGLSREDLVSLRRTILSTLAHFGER